MAIFKRTVFWCFSSLRKQNFLTFLLKSSWHLYFYQVAEIKVGSHRCVLFCLFNKSTYWKAILYVTGDCWKTVYIPRKKAGLGYKCHVIFFTLDNFGVYFISWLLRNVTDGIYDLVYDEGKQRHIVAILSVCLSGCYSGFINSIFVSIMIALSIISSKLITMLSVCIPLNWNSGYHK